MMKVFAAVLLLLLTLSDCHSEVVNSFESTCPEFFANQKSPTVFTGDKYKQICQIRDNTYEFATLYDTTNRIPVYSAYEFKGARTCDRPKKSWYIEPQLDNLNRGKKMISYNSKLLDNQAVNADYNQSGYHKGHLVPVYHAKDNFCAEATFTLTNAAPQNPSFNTGQWRVAEKNVSRTLQSGCLNKGYRAYIVTGVIPGNQKINKRVNVPSHFWSAFCCLDNNNIAKKSGGFYGENINKAVDHVNLTDLENKLTQLYNKRNFSVFNGKCIITENEPDLSLLNEECKDKGEKYSALKRALECIGKNTDAKKIRMCINKNCKKDMF